MSTIHILMGPERSGKTTEANRVFRSLPQHTEIYSMTSPTSSFGSDFVDGHVGVAQAYDTCVRAFAKAVTRTNWNVIIDDVNDTLWKLAPYVALAQAFTDWTNPEALEDNDGFEIVYCKGGGVDTSVFEENLRNWPGHWPQPRIVTF